MKFSALALDYDGTIATDGVFDPTVREAVGEVRQRGVVVILVTGRRLPDLHAVEQPLILAFNRGRLMILPQAIGKSTGLRHALFSLRISIHNTIGVGDAENDHDLLDACEVEVADAVGQAIRARYETAGTEQVE